MAINAKPTKKKTPVAAPTKSPVSQTPDFTPALNYTPVNQNYTPNIPVNQSTNQPQNFSSVNQNYTPANAAPTSQPTSRLPSQGAAPTTPSLQSPTGVMPSGGGSTSNLGGLTNLFNSVNPNLVQQTNDQGQTQFVDNPQVKDAGLGTHVGIGLAMSSTPPLGAFPIGIETKPLSQIFRGLFNRETNIVGGSTGNAAETLNKGLYKTEYIFDESGSVIGRVNTKITAQTTSRLGKALKTYGLALGTISLGIGLITQTMQTWQMNQWSKVDNANFALNQAYQNALLSGDEQSLAQIKEMQGALTSNDFWSNLVPGAGLKTARDAMAMQYKMQNQLEADMKLLESQRNFSPINQGGVSTFVTPDGRIIQNTEKTNKNFFQEIQQMSRARELQQQKEDAERFAEQQRMMRDEAQKARKAEMYETAAFWEEQKKKQISLENKQRDETAQFWLNYKRMVIELETNAFNSRQQAFQQEDNAPSALSFGLLHS